MTTLAGAQLADGRWTALNTLTCAGFAVRNFGYKTVRGTVPVRDAWVDVADGAVVGVHAALDLAGIDTAHAKRDRDLRAPRLLDTAKCPSLIFAGGRPEPVPSGWEIPGRLAGRGEVDVVLVASVVGRGSGGELTVRATTSFDRRDLGVRAPRFLIGRRVDVTIEAVFTPPT